jgi:hypothetical protein
MPRFLSNILDRTSRKDTAPVNRYAGIQSNGAVVLRDRRGMAKAGIPDATEKSMGMGDDPLAGHLMPSSPPTSNDIAAQVYRH